jgi:hypothetical protein
MSILYRRLSAYECRVSKLWYSSDEKIKGAGELSCLFDVYYTNYARAFIIAAFLQLLPMIAYFIMILIQKFLFIGLNMTHLDVHRMGQRNVRFSLALHIANNFKLKQAMLNWINFLLKFRRKKDIIIYQQVQQGKTIVSNSV